MEVLSAHPVRENPRRESRGPDRGLLELRELTVRICPDNDREIRILDRISFDIAACEIVGLLGESGCGKTTTALSIMGLLPAAARVASGAILWRGGDLLARKESRLREIRGAEISLISQDTSVLNPVMRVGDQVAEVLRAHRPWSSGRVREEAKALLAAVGLGESDRIYRAYPHQLSGGQRQRVVIAQAVACKPALVIADETTASLDASTSVEILDLLKRLKAVFGTSFLFITHDPAILATLADRVMVMYAGQIVESGPLSEVYEQPLHPYTQALLRCTQPLTTNEAKGGKPRLACIPGEPPDPAEVLSGCSFANRCQERFAACDPCSPEPVRPSAGRVVRCFKYGG